MAGCRDDQLSPDGDRWRIELAEWCLSDAETNAVIKQGTQCEIDSDVWTIPAERMKAKAAHRVPLSIRALQVLVEARSLSDGDGVVFPSPATGRALTNEAFSKLLRELGIDGTAHGMRTAFRSWAAEQGVSREVAEGCLAHVVKGTQGAYQRSDLHETRAGHGPIEPRHQRPGCLTTHRLQPISRRRPLSKITEVRRGPEACRRFVPCSRPGSMGSS